MEINEIELTTLTDFDEEIKGTIRSLFLAYQDELGLDLCFQGFHEELAQLPGQYSEPNGCIVVAKDANEIIGVVALKPLDENTCEMKRLYIKPKARGKQIGKALVDKIIKIASQKNYSVMKLDSLAKLKAAIAVYKSFGFKETKPYNYNPDETVVYFSLSLK